MSAAANQHWTIEEDHLLRTIIEARLSTGRKCVWVDIARELGTTRSADAVGSYWRRQQAAEGITGAQEPKITAREIMWTEEEENILLDTVQKSLESRNPTDWVAIAVACGNKRTPNSYRTRWYAKRRTEICKNVSSCIVPADTTPEGQNELQWTWNMDELERLADVVDAVSGSTMNTSIVDWDRVAEMVAGGRTAISCKQRWDELLNDSDYFSAKG